VLRRIQKIEGVGSFTSARAGDVELGKINVVYGENRNGKSTLCDIFISLADNAPEVIASRRTIAKGAKQDIEPFVQFQFEGDGGVQFRNGQWNTRLNNSQLYVFDHGFVHRNVMTGLEVVRDNSENVSDFILGETGVKIANELEQKKVAAKNARKKVKALEDQFYAIGIQSIKNFIALDKPSETVDELNEAIELITSEIENYKSRLSRLSQLLNRKEPSQLAVELTLGESLERVNRCLGLSVESAHEDATSLVEAQLSQVNNKTGFKGWASSGLTHLDSNCPFCGQALTDEARQLIESYQKAFNDRFTQMVEQAKTGATDLLGKGIPSIDTDALSKEHEINQELIRAFNEIESDVTTDLVQLAEDYNLLNDSLSRLNKLVATVYEIAIDRLKLKIDTPYQPQAPVPIDEVSEYEQHVISALGSYEKTLATINAKIKAYKSALNADSLKERIAELGKDKNELEEKQLRLMHESLCNEYKEKLYEVASTQESFEKSKKELEASQEEFLTEYFTETNRLFEDLGTSGFEINRKPNNQGSRPVYDLEVKFNDKTISRKNFNRIFSESDRRALALCIFIAKINKLPESEKQSAVLVLDDPCTSFDSERMTLITKSFSQLSKHVKQIIITTHYKELAAKLVSRFDACVSLKIVKNESSSDFNRATEAELTESAHDEAYRSIMEVIEGSTQEKRVHHLRPFLEHEVRQRFKAQLLAHSASSKTSFSRCIEILSDNDYLSDDIRGELDDFREELNPPMHELMQQSFSDIQSLAKHMMDFIYHRLR